MNSVFLMGRLTADVELRHNEAGTAKGQCTLAVPRIGAKEGTQATDFINIVVWNKQAESLAKFMGKGSQIGVEGVLRADNYTDRDGNKRTFNYVLAQRIHFLSETKKDDKGEEKTESDFEESFSLDGIEITEEDLPF